MTLEALPRYDQRSRNQPRHYRIIGFDQTASVYMPNPAAVSLMVLKITLSNRAAKSVAFLRGKAPLGASACNTRSYGSGLRWRPPRQLFFSYAAGFSQVRTKTRE